MQNLTERINILQIILVAAALAFITGLAPLADGANVNLVFGGLLTLSGEVTVLDKRNTARVVDALADIPFKSEQVRAFFDALQMFMGSTEPAQMGSVVTTTTVTPSALVGVAAMDEDLSSRG